MEVKTNFKFKDGRRYVHSSSLMEELWINVFPQLQFAPADFLVDAKFNKKINGNGHFFIEKVENTNIQNPIYSASFKIFNDSCSKFIYFKDDGSKILESINSKITIHNYKTDHNFSGSALIKVGEINEFIENIVELNKKIHLDSVDNNKKKVINLYMKNVPAIKREYQEYIEAKIVNISLRHSEIGLITLNKVTFQDVPTRPMVMSYILQDL